MVILSCTGSIQLSQRIFLQILGELMTMEYIGISQEIFSFPKCRVDKKFDNCSCDPSKTNLMSVRLERSVNVGVTAISKVVRFLDSHEGGGVLAISAGVQLLYRNKTPT